MARTVFELARARSIAAAEAALEEERSTWARALSVEAFRRAREARREARRAARAESMAHAVAGHLHRESCAARERLREAARRVEAIDEELREAHRLNAAAIPPCECQTGMVGCPKAADASSKHR